ncbi:MAG: HAMP domain-containing histidine kinase [Sphingomonas sp.]|nr:HAMP domain-containing histidine kinase [Sphingomonas sp.]
MPKLRHSAAYRLAFGYTAVCALAVLVTGLGVYYAASAMLWHDFDRSIAQEMAGLEREYGEGGVPDLIDALARHARRSGNGFRYALFDRTGEAKLRQASLVQVRPGWGETRLEEKGQPSRHARFLSKRLPTGETLMVAADAHDLDRLRNTLFGALTAGFILILGLGAAGAILFGRHLRKRLDPISSTAEAIVAGDLKQRVSVGTSGDEFDRAGESLNLMLDRVAQLVENLRQVSSDVAHDLRTPLQRLRGAVESGLHGAQEIASLRAALENALSHSEAVLALFDAILRICEVEAGGARERFEVIDLAALVGNICEMYGPAIEDGGRTLVCDNAQCVPMRGDSELLTQMLTNLLDNAVLHTPPGTSVLVSAQSSTAGAQLIVADTGPGVPTADRERIIQRFVRLDRGRTTNGHGLGLNLVAAIVAAHGGCLKIEDNSPGMRVNILLPVAQADTLPRPCTISSMPNRVRMLA